VLFDADALTCASGRGAGPRVITPHPGEAGRLLGLGAEDVQADRFGAVKALASGGSVALLKGRYSLIAQEGTPISVNQTGNPVLATGGSGDVLSGVIGALLARGVTARDAARLGAFVHGLAADRLAAVRAGGWTAGDVADAIPDAIEELCSP
jgi:NAD(P)H-hydrate epimerase